MPKFINNVQISWDHIDPVEYKYIDINKALRIFPQEALNVLEIMMPYLTGNYKYTLVDLKVRQLKKGQYGCPLPDWHYDCVKDYEHPSKHENHLLYTNLNGTEIQHDGQIIKANDGDIWQYSRDLHRTSKMTDDCKRVLLRLTECDNVKPTPIKRK